MCDLHINVKMGFFYYREQYTTNHYSAIWTFRHFRGGYIQVYFTPVSFNGICTCKQLFQVFEIFK
jgi:hypothetical protein